MHTAPKPSELRAASAPSRPLAHAIVAGLRRRCPNCAEGPMFRGFLTVRDHCPHCGEALHHHRADDLPPYLTVLALGHILIPAVLILERLAAPPLWVAYGVLFTGGLALTLALLPPIKGAVIALQWARRMHGFGDSAPPPSEPPA